MRKNICTRRSYIKSASSVGVVSIAGCVGDDDDQFVTIGTGGTGGTFYPVGGAIADLLNENLDIEASAESTAAGAENLQLLQQGEIEIGMAQTNGVLDAIEGEGDFDEPFPVAGLFGSYLNQTQVVVLEDSGIDSIQDMEGESISTGAPGSGTEVQVRELLDWYGITFDDLDQERLSFGETVDAMLDNQIAGGFFTAGVPTGAVEEVAAQADVRFIDFPSDELDGITEDRRMFVEGTVPGETYPGQDEDFTAPSETNVFIVDSEMDYDRAYDIVEVVFENLEQLEEAQAVTQEIPDNARNIPFDLHPGAEDALDDLGF